MKKRKYILCIYALIILLTVSCKKNYDLRNEKSAADQIVEDLKTKKIIFISENHDEVYPIIFLTEHLEKFYEEGLRYIFLEAGDDGFLGDTNLSDYTFNIVPPWSTFACKYEQHLMEIEIQRINNVHKDAPIKVIWPEHNLVLPNSRDVSIILNCRDNHIQKEIIDVLEKSKPEEKAIVFYGSAHGSKTPEQNYAKHELNPNWKTIGVYLSEYYGSNFSSFFLDYFKPYKKEKSVFSKNNTCVTLSEQNLTNYVPEEYKSKYDYFCVYKEAIFGVIYPYINDVKIKIALKNKVNKIQSEKPEDKNAETETFGIIENLLFVYYQKYAQTNNQKQEIGELEKYIEFLYSYGWIEDYLYEPANDERIGYVLCNMNRAKKIAPNNDIWPQYWISYFETEKAKYSGKKNDYKKALAEWNKLLENDLLYASPVLKLTYQKISMCEEKLGNTEKSQYYKQKESEVNMLYEIDYEKYVYFGY